MDATDTVYIADLPYEKVRARADPKLKPQPRKGVGIYVTGRFALFKHSLTSESDSVLIAFWDSKLEEEAVVWVRKAIKAKDGLAQVASICLTAWQALVESKGFGDLSVPEEPLLKIEGKSVEAALLDRKLTGSVHYRTLDLNRLKG